MSALVGGFVVIVVAASVKFVVKRDIFGLKGSLAPFERRRVLAVLQGDIEFDDWLIELIQRLDALNCKASTHFVRH